MKLLATLLALSALLVALPSCASFEQPSASPSILAQMGQRGVPSGTIKRISSGRVLDFDDILALVKANVSDKGVVAYLKSTRAPYTFSTAQLQQLTNAGAGSDLVNYLGKSIGYYEATKASQLGGSKWDNNPYFNDPLYWGAAPFPYAFPGEWIDPGFVFGPL